MYSLLHRPRRFTLQNILNTGRLYYSQNHNCSFTMETQMQTSGPAYMSYTVVGPVVCIYLSIAIAKKYCFELLVYIE